MVYSIPCFWLQYLAVTVIVCYFLQPAASTSCSDYVAAAQAAETGHDSDTANMTRAFEHWTAALRCGAPEAHFTAAALLNQGLLGMPHDPAAGMLHMWIASTGGYAPAHLALAWQHGQGQGAAKSCEAALPYARAAAVSALATRQVHGSYPALRHDRLSPDAMVDDKLTAAAIAWGVKSAAQTALRVLRANFSAPASSPVGRPVPAYGVVSSGIGADRAAEADIADYLLSVSSKGDWRSALALGKLLYQGARGAAHDYAAAAKALEDASAVALHEAGEGDPSSHADASKRGAEGSDPAASAAAALAILGEMALTGRGMPPDVQLAGDALHEATEAGHAAGTNALAVMYALGLAQPTDAHIQPFKQLAPGERRLMAAMQLWQKAGAAGNAAALYNLGMLHLTGGVGLRFFPRPATLAAAATGIPPELSAASRDEKLQRVSAGRIVRDFGRALQLFQAAAEGGHAPAAFAMANMQARGLASARTCPAAYRTLLQVAHRSYLGSVVDRAFKRLVAAGTGGNLPSRPVSSAQPGSLRLGQGWWDGPEHAPTAGIHGPAADLYLAALLEYARAAAQGYQVAHWNTALLLGHQPGLTTGYIAPSAVAAFATAAAQPSSPQPPSPSASPASTAQDTAAAESGPPVRASRVAAELRMLAHAAANGDPDARVRLASVHLRGDDGLPVSHTAAAAHYRAAAEHLHPAALFELGTLHEQGLGLRPDLHLAKRYYDRAGSASDAAWLPVTLAVARVHLKAAAVRALASAPHVCHAIAGHEVGRWLVRVSGLVPYMPCYAEHAVVGALDPEGPTHELAASPSAVPRPAATAAPATERRFSSKLMAQRANGMWARLSQYIAQRWQAVMWTLRESDNAAQLAITLCSLLVVVAVLGLRALLRAR